MAKTKGNLADLEAEVIYNGLCCYCGTCGAFCKEYIAFENELPKTKQKCYEICGACYEFCPRTFFAPFQMDRELFGEVRTDNLLGYYQGEIRSARAADVTLRDRAQDGGVISAVLLYLLQEGEIDAAVVTRTSEEDHWQPEPFVATTKDDVLAAAGSKYTQCPAVLGVADAFEAGYQKIALVGLPCHIEGIRKAQLSDAFQVRAERVKFLIGLFCTETFDRELLARTLKELGTTFDAVAKFNIRRGRFIVTTKEGKELTMPIKKMRAFAREACNYCYDFASEFADISVGSIGSEDGWSTVIARSDAGEDVLERAQAAGFIETKRSTPEQIAEVRKLAAFKKRENWKHISEKAEPVRIMNLLVEPELLEHFFCTE
ncbi:MAG: Coenzyme F420 hydrogenase/dehydrogenase, beta subunit C-terminal domain [Candidatus Methanospirareceae archaeon]